VSRDLLAPSPVAEGDWPVSAPPTARMMRALLDLAAQLDELHQRNIQSEEDRARRLTVITEQGKRIGEVEAERNNLRSEATALRAHADFLETDRATRLRVIEEQGRHLGELEAERNNLRSEATALHAHADFLETDRAARLRVIEEQGRDLSKLAAELKEMQAEVEAQHQQIDAVMGQLLALQHLMTAVQRTRVYRLLRRLGRWKFIEQAFASLGSSPESSGDER